MRLVPLLYLGILSLTVFGCAGSKAKAQELVLECDVLFEYQHVENDSISLMVGNNIRLHTGKAIPGQFYPLLLSVRDPQDLDKPTSTEVIGSQEQLLLLIKSKFPLLKRFGLIIGGNTSQNTHFAEENAIRPIRELAKQVSDSEILLFHEKDGEIISIKTLQ